MEERKRKQFDQTIYSSFVDHLLKFDHLLSFDNLSSFDLLPSFDNFFHSVLIFWSVHQLNGQNQSVNWVDDDSQWPTRQDQNYLNEPCLKFS